LQSPRPSRTAIGAKSSRPISKTSQRTFRASPRSKRVRQWVLRRVRRRGDQRAIRNSILAPESLLRDRSALQCCLVTVREDGVRQGRVQAICDYVHDHTSFGYEHACMTRTAWEAHRDQAGVCRDFAHLAIAFCRCMNIPARYCTGYLGDSGVPPAPDPMDFSAWFEAYLGDRWYTFDAPTMSRVSAAS
jgi:hypothetical protein